MILYELEATLWLIEEVRSFICEGSVLSVVEMHITNNQTAYSVDNLVFKFGCVVQFYVCTVMSGL